MMKTRIHKTNDKSEVIKAMRGLTGRLRSPWLHKGLTYMLVCILTAFVMGLTMTAKADAANSTNAGIVSAWASGTTSIKVKMTYTGDDNANNTYTIKWKLCTDGTYPPANVINGAHTASPYIAEITGLTANTCYNIQGTYNDADGVSGVNPQTLKIYSTWDSTLLHNSNRFQGTTKWGGDWGTQTGQYGQFVCGTCHEPRALNIKGIKSTITAPSGSFPGGTVNFNSTTNAPNNFGDDTGGHTTSTRICEVCHSQTNYHRYNTTGQSNLTHNNNTDCTQCHPHATGFYYATSSCDACHGNPPTTATLGGPTGLATPATGATNPLSPGAHNTHVATRGMTCDACHKGTAMPASEKKIDMGFSISGTTYPGFQNTVNSGTFTGYNALSNGYTWNASWAGTTVLTAANYDNRCSSIYCHGSTLTGGSNTSPSWVGGAAEAACGTCHGASASTPPTAGSHTKHASSAAGNYGLACTKCHPNVTDGSHVNGSVAWDLDDTDTRIGASATYRGSNAGQTGQLAPSSTYGSCSNIYCHSDVQGANGSGNPSTYATPTWGGTVNCGSCHKNMLTDAAATGSHVQHAQTQSIACATCHNGYTDSTVNTTTHVNQSINLSFSGQATGTTYSQGTTHAPGNGYGTCSTNQCHGSGTPTWGNNTNNNTCTKCHGTPTAGTIDATNRYLVAPPKDTAGNTGTQTGTGQVDTTANSKIGAHQTHLRYLNGARSTAIDTQDDRCIYCHGTLPTSGTHANGTATPVFQGLATNNGAMSATYSAGSCSNTYCHNPAGTGGTLLSTNTGSATTPTWTDANYLADPTLKTQANCGKCHKVPGDTGFEPAATHSGMTISNTDCSGCHGHNGDTAGIAGQRHIDGIKYGGGNCDSCHDYDVVGATYSAGVWTGGTWGKLPYRDGLNPGQGWGAHAKHINHIKTRLGIATALNPVGQTFGVGDPANVCGTCHTNLVANHTMGGSTVRTINFGDGTYKYGGSTGFSFVFGSTNPVYNGVSGTSSSVNPKTCSNISCHFSTTPVWSSY